MTLDSFIEELEQLSHENNNHNCRTADACGDYSCLNTHRIECFFDGYANRILAMAKALKAADAAVRCNCLGCNLQAGDAVLCDKDTYWDLRAEVEL